MAEAEIQKSLLRSEGFILIILTTAVYAAFLAREMGFADYFSIPQELITTSHIGLATAAKSLVWGAMAYIGKVNIVWIFAPRGERMLFNLLRRAILIFLVIGFAMYPYLTSGTSWWWAAAIYGTMAFSLFIWPLITQRGVNGYENKVAVQIKIDASSNDIYGSILDKVDISARFTLIFIITTMIFAYGEGRRSAIEKDEYYLLDGEPNMALVKIYGEVAISVGYEPKERRLNGLIRAAKIPDSKGMNFRLTKIGRITRPIDK